MTAFPLDNHFVLRKLHSLLGIVPIGAFLAFHLWENSLASRGAEYFTEHVVMKIDSMRFVTVMEILFIALPILFHGIYGVIIWLQGRSNVSQYGYFRNWMYLMHRISGLIAFVFILLHVWQTRGQVLLGKLPKEELYDTIVGLFSGPIWQIWYGIGILASCYHLANGIWLALITWGVTIGPRSQRISTVVCAGVGAAIFAFGMAALFGFEPPTAS